MLFKIDKFWKILNFILLSLIALSLFAKKIPEKATAHDMSINLLENSTERVMNISSVFNCVLELPQNYFAHISNSNYTFNDEMSHCLPFFDIRQRQKGFDRSSFINYYLTPALILDPETKTSLSEWIQHILSKNIRMLVLKELANGNFNLTSSDSLRVITPTTIASSAYLILEYVSKKNSLIRKTHKVLMVGTIIYSSEEPLEKETYGILATDVALNLGLAYGFSTKNLNELSQESALYFSSIYILPLALYAHDLISTEDTEEYEKKSH